MKGLEYPITVDSTITIPRYYGDYSYYPDDTFIDSVCTTCTNYNTWQTMYVGKRPTPSDTISFIVFYNINSLIPAGSQINSALFKAMVAASGGTSTIQVQSIDQAWTPSLTSWNNRPAYGNYLGTTRSTFPGSMSYAAWDTTQLVTEWFNNTRVNNGLALVKTAGSVDGYVSFYTRDYPAARYPYLEVTYTVPPPDTTPPTSSIIDPPTGSYINGDYVIRGSSNDTGTGVKKVEVSTNGGSSWVLAQLGLGGSWTYDWSAPSEGVFNIESKATDNSNNIESPGPGVTVTVDNTLPTALITSPTVGQTLSGSFDLLGTATDQNFSNYKVEYGEGASPTNWTKIGPTETKEVNNGLLKRINFGAGNGTFTFKLTVTDKANQIKTASVTVALNNLPTVSPHANYTQDPDQCVVCHRSHTASMARLLNSGAGVIYQVDFCYSCHDGTGSMYNVKAAFDTNSSYHPIKNEANSAGILDCSNCHDPHGVKKPDGTYYAKLLKSKDSSGNVYFEGNEFCGACHGPGSTLIRGDHLTDFIVIPHNTMTPNPLSGTKIKCLNCHANNNSSASEGTVPHGSDFSRITKANEEDVCNLCHDNPANSENGINIKELFSYPSNLFFDYDRYTFDGNYAQPGTSWLSARHNINNSEQTDADPNTAGNQSSRVECTSCHNAHKNDRGNKKVANPDDPTNLFEELNTDPKYWNTTTNSGKVVLQPDFAEGKDARIESGWNNNTNLGTSDDLAVGRVDSQIIMRTLIQFDLSKIPTGASITSATLYMPLEGAQGIAPLTVNAHQVLSDWSELLVTFANQSSINSSTSASVSLSSTVNTADWSMQPQFSITSLVQQWISNPASNKGLMLIASDAEAGSAYWLRQFSSSDNYTVWVGGVQKNDFFPSIGGTIFMRPKLVIEYTSAIQPEILNAIKFCLSCHDGNPPAGVTMPNLSVIRGGGQAGGPETFTDILNVAKGYLGVQADGSINLSKADMHGAQAGAFLIDGVNPEGDIIGPYYPGIDALLCTDCHDPHGSNNAYHLKTIINNKPDISIKSTQFGQFLNTESGTTSSNGYELCGSCHTFAHVPGLHCTNCHYHGAKADNMPSTNF